MVVPSRLRARLVASNRVNATLESFIDDLPQPQFFFPEYTNHAKSHIEKVLFCIDKLISDSTLNILSDDAIYVLVYGACIHDFGMFITSDGLKELLSNDDWISRWEKFNKEMKMLSSKKLQGIFGMFTLPDVSKDDIKNISELDWIKRLYIGEFIRKHHHAIPYEMMYQNI
jgi:hypothetical protein